MPPCRPVCTAAQFHPGAALFAAEVVALAAARAVATHAVRVLPPYVSPHLSEETPAGTRHPRRRPREQQEKAQAAEQAAQCVLLRDIFGPSPHWDKPVAPSLLGWGGGTVVKLAHVIYEERRFEDLPILADALEDAGCDDQVVLGHLREPGAVHARGCFCLDLILSKE